MSSKLWPIKQTRPRRPIVMIGPSMEHARGGMASVVIAYREAGLFKDWPIIYLETHRETTGLRKLCLGLSAIFNFIGMLFMCKPVLLHAHVAGKVSFWRKSVFMLTARCFGIPYILHLHGSEFRVFCDAYAGKWMLGYIRFIFDNASVIVALSDEWRSWISGISTNPNVELIYNPVQLPVNYFHDDLNPSRLNVVFLGKLVSTKGIFDLLKAFSSVVKNSPHPIHLYCGGEGENALVEQLIDELDLSKQVSLLGWIAGEAKIDLLKKADVLVLPSYNEVLPMAILEALAYGVPVVASRIGGIPDAITNGIEGFLVEPGDINSIANCILRLVTDVELRKSMREKARVKAASSFEDKMIISKLSLLYTRLGAESA